MTVSEVELQHIAVLAGLELSEEALLSLTEDVRAILAFMNTLGSVSTEGVLPLLHPFEQAPPWRADEAFDTSHIADLKQAAPAAFSDDGVYLVPKVIDTGQ